MIPSIGRAAVGVALVLGAVFAAPGLLLAQGTQMTDQERVMRFHDRRVQGQATWQSMSPEQQEAAIAKTRGAYETLSPRAKEAWSKLTPEQQQQAITTAKERTRAGAARAADAYQGLGTEQKQEMRQDNVEVRAGRREARQGE